MIRTAIRTAAGILVALIGAGGAASAQVAPPPAPVVSIAQTPAGDSLTIQQAVQEALANNLGMRAQAERIHAAEGQVRQAGVLPNPLVTSTVLSDRVFGGEGEGGWTTGVEQELETAGKRRYRTLVATSDLERVRYDTDTFQRDLVAETQKTYFALLQAQRDLDLTRETTAILQRFVDLNAERVRVGEAPGLDLNLARIELARAQRNAREFELRHREATARLNLLMGRPAASALVPSSEFSAPVLSLPSDEELMEASLANRPEVLAADRNLAARAAAVSLARAVARPNVTWGATYQEQRSIFGPGTFSGSGTFGGTLRDRDRLLVIQASVPLPFSNRNQGNIASAEYERRAAEASAQYVRKVVQNEVTIALANYRSHLQIRTLYDTSVLPELQRTIDAIQQAYQLGNESIFAVIQVQRTFFDARHEYLQTLLDLESDRIDLERATGRPLR